jgi:hypothetical protein
LPGSQWKVTLPLLPRWLPGIGLVMAACCGIPASMKVQSLVPQVLFTSEYTQTRTVPPLV